MNPKRLHELLAAWDEGRLDAAQAAELKQILATPEARREIYREARLDVALGDAVQKQLAAESDAATWSSASISGRARKQTLAFPRLAWAAAAALAVGLISSTVFFSRPLAYLGTVGGEVQLVRGKNTIRAQSGAALKTGDLLRTADGATARIAWLHETTQIDLQGGSELVLERLKGGKSLRLNRGAFTADVAHQPVGEPMMLHSPHARGEVLGTRFDLSTAPEKSSLTVASGRVVFSPREDPYGKVVEAGRRMEVTSDQIIQTGPLPMEQSLRLGLIGHWPMNEGTGDITRDVSGGGQDARLHRVSWGRGRDGTAIQFPVMEHGTSECRTPRYELPSVFTLAVWFRRESSGKMWAIAANSEGGLETSGFRWMLGRLVNAAGPPVDTDTFFVEVGNGTTWTHAYSEPLPIIQSRWHHAALVMDADEGETRLFFDGREVSRQSAIRNDFQRAGSLHFGALAGPNKHVFPGSIDDVRLYARALSVAEIAELAGGFSHAGRVLRPAPTSIASK